MLAKGTGVVAFMRHTEGEARRFQAGQSAGMVGTAALLRGPGLLRAGEPPVLSDIEAADEDEGHEAGRGSVDDREKGGTDT